MIREILAIALIVAGLGVLGWVIAVPDKTLSALPMTVGELTTGLWLFCSGWKRIIENEA